MKQKYQIILGLLIITISIMSLSSIVSATTYYEDTPYIRVYAEEISPEPVQPGQDLTVKIRIMNEGGSTAENVSVKLNSDFPFFVKTESNDFEDEKSLCVGCSMDNTFYLTVDANAKSGIYPLYFDVYQGESIIKTKEPINVKIIGKPDVILETKTIESEITSGDQFSINFYTKNIGTGIARNIKITPESDNILMLGSNINLIEEIKPDETNSVNIKFIVKESLEPDTYKFPIKLEYTDEQGNTYTNTFEIGLNIINKAEVAFQSIKTTPTNPTLVDELHIEGIVENTGTGDADKVIIELITEKNKTYKSFIGQLEADDDSPFYFDLKPELTGMNKLTLKITYYDDFGIHNYETTIDNEIRKPTNNIITVLIILLLLGAGTGYYFYKKKNTKK